MHSVRPRLSGRSHFWGVARPATPPWATASRRCCSLALGLVRPIHPFDHLRRLRLHFLLSHKLASSRRHRLFRGHRLHRSSLLHCLPLHRPLTCRHPPRRLLGHHRRRRCHRCPQLASSRHLQAPWPLHPRLLSRRYPRLQPRQHHSHRCQKLDSNHPHRPRHRYLRRKLLRSPRHRLCHLYLEQWSTLRPPHRHLLHRHSHRCRASYSCHRAYQALPSHHRHHRHRRRLLLRCLLFRDSRSPPAHQHQAQPPHERLLSRRHHPHHCHPCRLSSSPQAYHPHRRPSDAPTQRHRTMIASLSSAAQIRHAFTWAASFLLQATTTRQQLFTITRVHTRCRAAPTAPSLDMFHEPRKMMAPA